MAKQSLEDTRWQDTLVALESLKLGLTVDEADVNPWFNSWSAGARTSSPKP
ncbi:hypothetical protein [uncultured Paraglaciecola sp.]|uniref:hypothetical protein n=1 Tax=uncultured Paraglaciecola sp. TaxID=1765024 RepID=UPI0030DCA5BF